MHIKFEVCKLFIGVYVLKMAERCLRVKMSRLK